MSYNPVVGTLVHELKRRNKGGFSTKNGLATHCAEGGLGSALIEEAFI